MTEKHYWAGFLEGKFDDSYWVLEDMPDRPELMPVFKTRKEARKIYSDVRKVKIVEVGK